MMKRTASPIIVTAPFQLQIGTDNVYQIVFLFEYAQKLRVFGTVPFHTPPSCGTNNRFVFGRDTSERINAAILDIYEESKGKDYVRMSEKTGQALDLLRTFMFEHVYERANKITSTRSFFSLSTRRNSAYSGR